MEDSQIIELIKASTDKYTTFRELVDKTGYTAKELFKVVIEAHAIDGRAFRYTDLSEDYKAAVAELKINNTTAAQCKTTSLNKLKRQCDRLSDENLSLLDERLEVRNVLFRMAAAYSIDLTGCPDLAHEMREFEEQLALRMQCTLEETETEPEPLIVSEEEVQKDLQIAELVQKVHTLEQYVLRMLVYDEI